MASQKMRADDGTDAQNDGDSIAPMLSSQLETMTEVLESVTQSDMADMSDEELADVWSELKGLENAVEDARKETAESELENRVAPGERLQGISHIESHNKYVNEDAGAVIMRLVSAGIDYTDMVDLNASAIADAPVDVDIGRYEYTYFR